MFKRHISQALILALCLMASFAKADGDIPFTARTSLWNETVSTLDDDAKALITAPFKSPRKTATALAGIGVLVLLDKPLTRVYQNTVEEAFDGFALPNLPWEKKLTELGLASEDVWMLSGIAGSYAYGAITGDERSKRAAVLSSKALAYSFVTSQLVLKTVFARKRPCPDLDEPNCADGTFTDDPLDFGNFHGVTVAPDAYGTSMPSYHFTQYFAVARVYSGLYGDSWVPYGAASLLAVSNIRGHRHWVSDMVAGTALGIGIGEIVLRNSDAYRARSLTAAPLVTQNGTGLSFEMTF